MDDCIMEKVLKSKISKTYNDFGKINNLHIYIIQLISIQMDI